MALNAMWHPVQYGPCSMALDAMWPFAIWHPVQYGPQCNMAHNRRRFESGRRQTAPTTSVANAIVRPPEAEGRRTVDRATPAPKFLCRQVIVRTADGKAQLLQIAIDDDVGAAVRR